MARPGPPLASRGAIAEGAWRWVYKIHSRLSVAQCLIQRRRASIRHASIRHYLDTDTAFPERKDKEAKYRFSLAYRKFFDDIFTFAREFATDTDGEQRRRRDGPCPAPVAFL